MTREQYIEAIRRMLDSCDEHAVRFIYFFLLNLPQTDPQP